MIGSMFVGFIIGLMAGAITSRGERMGCIGKILLGWFGSWLGQLLFGHWGPMLADTAILPSVLGAVILLALFWDRGTQNNVKEIPRREGVQVFLFEPCEFFIPVPTCRL